VLADLRVDDREQAAPPQMARRGRSIGATVRSCRAVPMQSQEQACAGPTRDARNATIATARPAGSSRLAVIAELCARHNRWPPTYDQCQGGSLGRSSETTQWQNRPRRPITSGARARFPMSAAFTPGRSAAAEGVGVAFAQLPYRSMTVDGAGHSPACSRLNASSPRRRACVCDQS